jgi:hypothetical protein
VVASEKKRLRNGSGATRSSSGTKHAMSSVIARCDNQVTLQRNVGERTLVPHLC